MLMKLYNLLVLANDLLIVWASSSNDGACNEATGKCLLVEVV